MNRPRTKSRLDQLFWLAVGLLGASVAVFQFTNFDVALQDHFFDFATGRWLVDEHAPLGRAFFYQGPKYVIVLLGLALLVLAFGPARWRYAWRFGRRGLFVAVLTLATLPSFVAVAKVATNVVCPKEIQRYGGTAPYVKLFSTYPAGAEPAGGRCFPAAHAAGGFALIGLAWVRGNRRWRAGAVALGLTAGWIMGGYQILKGAHYLSDTVATMALAWIVTLAWRRIIRPAVDPILVEETVLLYEGRPAPITGCCPSTKPRSDSMPTSR